MSNEQSGAEPLPGRGIPTWVSYVLAAGVIAVVAWKKVEGARPATSLPEAPKAAGAAPRQLEIQELGYFSYDPVKGGTIPEDVRKLDGTTVRICGYMIPMEQAQEVTKFALVPNLSSCCYGEPPEMRHTITVSCPTGKSVEYVEDPVVVEGVLTVKEVRQDRYIVSIFQMTCARVEVAQ